MENLLSRKNQKEKILKEQAEKSLKKWQTRLGFPDWEFEVKVIEFKRPDGFLQDGDIIVNYPKKQATILIGTILKAPVEEIIVHELVHLILWPLDRKTTSIIKLLPKSKQKKGLDDFLGKLEKTAAKITKVFVNKY